MLLEVLTAGSGYDCSLLLSASWLFSLVFSSRHQKISTVVCETAMSTVVNFVPFGLVYNIGKESKCKTITGGQFGLLLGLSSRRTGIGRHLH